jgi:uncharacterized protein (TIGR03790 family)
MKSVTCIFLSLIGMLTTACGQEKPVAGPPTPGSVPIAEYAKRAVLLYNTEVPDGKELALHYAKLRGVPEANMVGLALPTKETISRAEFTETLETPLKAEFTKRGWWQLGRGADGNEMVLTANRRFIVIFQGVPLRITQEGPSKGAGQENAASVDSELMCLGVIDHPIDGPMHNPYYKKSADAAQLFMLEAMAPIFIVGRIDGPSKGDAKRLIDDAVAVEKTGLQGRAYIDLAKKDQAGYKMGEDWLINAAKLLSDAGFPTVIDVNATTYPTNYPMQDAALYFGWYALPPDGPFLNPKFKFKQGAVACHIHSFSATSLRNPKEGYLAPFIKMGAAALPGNVWEPYLGLTVELDKLNTCLQKGYTVGEAAMMASVGISWMNVVVGDPLYRPFPDGATPAKQDAEYAWLRSILKKFKASGKTDRKPLLDAIEAEAKLKRSGILYEALAHLAMGVLADDDSNIITWFDQAYGAYKGEADKIRVRCIQAEYLKRIQFTDVAKKLLATALKTHGSAPEAKSLEVIQATLGK